MIKTISSNDKEGKLSFITDMSTSLANAIRRSVLEIPTMAIDEAEIIKNDSALYDEIIAHRMGLIPIKADKGTKELKFKLKEVGPKTVYSTDLHPSTDTEYKLPIVLLDEEQELEVLCEARLGKGIDHIKYSPGLVYYRHNIDPGILDFVVIDDEGKASFNEEELNQKKLTEADLNKIKKTKKVNELIFNIESWGQIKSKDIFLRAVDALNENLEELEKAIK
ncbi:MAG: hypothetical protein Q8N99_02795 [Nanoarchaeota archaeon]|nr:hypothetical protein [Nanoarchaeota archaeon]